jgi:hypothetical protein
MMKAINDEINDDTDAIAIRETNKTKTLTKEKHIIKKQKDIDDQHNRNTYDLEILKMNTRVVESIPSRPNSV